MFLPSAQRAAAGPALSSVPVVPAAVLGAPVAAPTITAPDALDRWRAILDTFTAIRPVFATDDGQIFPGTTVGDVQRAALRFSRMLCAPCYDGAQLTDTRAAWRDALARVQAHTQGAPWSSTYPDNPGWWLSDTRALAQRLAEVDRRRNGIVQAGDGTLTITGGRRDPLVTYLDLRAYFLARRMSRVDDTGHRYPETTARDVLEVIRIVDEDITATVAATPPGQTAEWLFDHHRLNAWREIAQLATKNARAIAPDMTHPNNRAIWSEYRKLSVPLSVVRSATKRPPAWGLL